MRRVLKQIRHRSSARTLRRSESFADTGARVHSLNEVSTLLARIDELIG